MGDHYRYDEDGETEFVIPKENVLIHPGYDTHPEAYIVRDICLLKLPKGEEITFGENIQPACLPNEADNFTGQTCWTAGWGDTQNFSIGQWGMPNELREVDVDVFPQKYCNAKYNDPYERKFF